MKRVRMFETVVMFGCVAGLLALGAYAVSVLLAKPDYSLALDIISAVVILAVVLAGGGYIFAIWKLEAR